MDRLVLHEPVPIIERRAARLALEVDHGISGRAIRAPRRQTLAAPRLAGANCADWQTLDLVVV